MRIRWPFVSRGAYNAMVDQRDYFKDEVDDYRRLTRELQKDVETLKASLQTTVVELDVVRQRSIEQRDELLYLACAARLSCEKMGIAT